MKFSLERYAATGSLYADMRNDLDKVEIVDDYTYRAYTKGKKPFFPDVHTIMHPAAQGLVMPKDYLERYGAEYFERQPVGSGPFKFVRRVPGDMVEHEALDKHWRQVPDFKKLAVILMPEETARVASLKTSTVDVIDIALEAALDVGAAGFTTFAISFQKPSIALHGAYDPRGAAMPIADVRVRQALSLAVNRDEIIKTFFYGKALPAWVGYTIGSQSPESDLDTAYWQEYSAKILRYDPAEAKQLLKAAGYPDGFTIDLWSCAIGGAPYLPKLAEVVQSYWAKIGVKTNLVPVDFGAYSALRRTQRSPTMIGKAATFRSGAGSGILPVNLRWALHSDGTFDLPWKAFPEVDKLIDDALSEVDVKKRKEMLAKVIKIDADSYVYLPIAEAPGFVALGPRVSIDFPRVTTIRPVYYADIAKHRK